MGMVEVHEPAVVEQVPVVLIVRVPLALAPLQASNA